MSLRTEPIFDVPELKARLAQAAFSKGNLYLQLRNEVCSVDISTKPNNNKVELREVAFVAIDFAEQLVHQFRHRYTVIDLSRG